MAFSMSMVQTVFQASNKRFTTKKSRGAGFNLWYLYMNVGAAAGGFIVDIFYKTFGLARFHIFSIGIGTAVLCIIVTLLLIKNTKQLYSPGEKPETPLEKRDKKSPLQIVKSVMTEPVFWRFTILITLLLGVRAVFLYLGLLHPKYWTRVIGPDAAVGALQAFNPILVIIGLILFIPLLKRFNVYKMLVYGAIITSLSIFVQAIPPFGTFDIGTFTYFTTIVFLIILTVGELIWSPRLSEYTAAIAPEGQEGTYLGLSMVPYFGAKMVVSFASGYMLSTWCPEGIGERLREGSVPFWESPSAMWFVLGTIALTGALVALLLKPWFTKGVDFDVKPEKAPEKSKTKIEEQVIKNDKTNLENKGISPAAISSLTWGIAGIFVMGFICGPVAIIQGLKAKDDVATGQYSGLKKAKLGTILGTIALFTHGILLFVGLFYLAMMETSGGH